MTENELLLLRMQIKLIELQIKMKETELQHCTEQIKILRQAWAEINMKIDKFK